MNTGYVTMVKHDKRANIYEVEVSSEIMPYLVALAENFTSYDLTVAISLKSAYSQRFYEYCCQFKNRTNKTFFFSVDDLKKMMMLEDKKGYDNSSNFKTKVLDVAQKELKEAYDNGQSDLYFDYQVKDKQGRKILSWFFFIHTKDEEQKTDYKTVGECIRQIHNILTTFFPRDSKYIKRVIAAVNLRPDIAMELTEKMQKKVNDYSRKEIAPIIRYVLREDYNIEAEVVLDDAIKPLRERLYRILDILLGKVISLQEGILKVRDILSINKEIQLTRAVKDFFDLLLFELVHLLLHCL